MHTAISCAAAAAGPRALLSTAPADARRVVGAVAAMLGLGPAPLLAPRVVCAALMSRATDSGSSGLHPPTPSATTAEWPWQLLLSGHAVCTCCAPAACCAQAAPKLAAAAPFAAAGCTTGGRCLGATGGRPGAAAAPRVAVALPCANEARSAALVLLCSCWPAAKMVCWAGATGGVGEGCVALGSMLHAAGLM